MGVDSFGETNENAMKKYHDFFEFSQDFSNSDQCYAYLCEAKWAKGYQCRKCGNEKCIKGRTWYYRKCNLCYYDESCTSHTLFHKLKFPIVKAFWIVYQLGTMKKGMSTVEISRQYDIHQETAWFFKRKVQQAMSTGSDGLLGGAVEIDETVIGGAEQDMKGRSHGKKKMVAVAVEMEYSSLQEEKPLARIKRAFAKVITGYSGKELSEAVEGMIHPDAVLITDGWRGYSTAVGSRWHAEFSSEQGANFEKLHWHIFNIKNWIRGIHHKISAAHTQHYLDEYHYRFNRRNFTSSNPVDLLQRFVSLDWLPYQFAKGR